MTKPFDPIKPCATRAGHRAERIATFEIDGVDLHLFKWHSRLGDCWSIVDKRGSAITNGTGIDLINVPDKRTLWVAIVSSSGTERIIHEQTEHALRARIEFCDYTVLDGPFARTFEVKE